MFLTAQTIKTDGDVEAQGFSGDGSNLTGVDSDLLDGMDSAEFAASGHTHLPSDVVGEKRGYYLTSGMFDGSEPLTACGAGYHMASKWDLRNLDQLFYDNSASGALTPADAGPGEQPPLGLFTGWIRTGFSSVVSTGVGTTNCGKWTSTAQEGTVFYLVADELPIGWRQATRTCTSDLWVWCVEDLD
jgi:hypothetical protein